MHGDETDGDHTKGGNPPTGKCVLTLTLSLSLSLTLTRQVRPRAHCTYCRAHTTILLRRNCSYDSMLDLLLTARPTSYS